MESFHITQALSLISWGHREEKRTQEPLIPSNNLKEGSTAQGFQILIRVLCPLLCQLTQRLAFVTSSPMLQATVSPRSQPWSIGAGLREGQCVRNWFAIST